LRSRSLFLALLAAFALALALWISLPGRKSPEPTVTSPATTTRPAASETVRAEQAGTRTTATLETPPPDGLLVAGRVVDLAGAALPDLAVGVRGDERDPAPVARSGDDGRFELLLESTPCEIEVLEPGWTTVRFGQVALASGAEEPVVVAARAVALEGQVVEPSGDPLARASLVVRAGSGLAEFSVRSGAAGRFRFEALPSLAKLRLRTTLEGWQTDERELTLPAGELLRIVLTPADSLGPLLEGTVVHPDGTPAPGALVSLGAVRTLAGEQGRFRLHCGWCTPETPLVARARGYQPAIVAGYGKTIDPQLRTLPPERLQLPGPELVLTGRVVDASGAPQKGWHVRIEDPTALDPGGRSRDYVESETGGRDELRTDAQGDFRFSGLAARAYTLLAWGRDRASRSELVVRSEPVPAGTRNVLLRVEGGAAGRVLRGRVVDETGTALAAVNVGLGRVAAPRSPAEFALQSRLRTQTDADGRFEILGAPAGVLYLVAAEPGFLPQRLELSPDAPAAALTLRLDSLRPFRFVSEEGAAPPDRLRAVGPAGSAELWSLAGAQPARTGVELLIEGRSARLSAGPDAREIVLYRGLTELARFPAPARSSGAGEETILRWP